MGQRRAVIIGISGCSSSGKTTLARLLRDIFPETFILHEDDFYKPESELPIKDGLADWDCPEAISIPDLELALTHIRATGTFPPTVTSLEDLNSVGACPATPGQISACAARVRDWLSPGRPGSRIFARTTTTTTTTTTTPSSPSHGGDDDDDHRQPSDRLRVCLVDGFLLYAPPALARVMSLLDVKLFLRAGRATAVGRRGARDGYVTLDGFWKDPPGYVETIVWPNYVEAHRWLFEGAQVEGGRLDAGVLRREGIEVLDATEKGEDVEFGRVLEWAVEAVMRGLERVVLGEESVDGVREGEGEGSGDGDGEGEGVDGR
ncbi:ribosylnicotinamide kinase [Madurella fahalii]|uniref:Ribosylnicotinamide kinase n=1 Tax=Madurella fahalii TaxID=1157608 RepID=A0ABQ0G6F9_9PEZI